MKNNTYSKSNYFIFSLAVFLLITFSMKMSIWGQDLDVGETAYCTADLLFTE